MTYTNRLNAKSLYPKKKLNNKIFWHPMEGYSKRLRRNLENRGRPDLLNFKTMSKLLQIQSPMKLFRHWCHQWQRMNCNQVRNRDQAKKSKNITSKLYYKFHQPETLNVILFNQCLSHFIFWPWIFIEHSINHN